MTIYRENAVEFITGDKTATVSLSSKKHVNRILRLADKYPNEVEILAQNADGSLCAKVPVKWIKFNPPVNREVTEEQRQAARERLQRYRSLKKEKKYASD